MKNPWKILAIALGVLLILSLIWQYYTLHEFDDDFEYLETKSQAILEEAKRQGVVFTREFADEYGEESLEPYQEPEPIDVSADDDFFLGNDDAKVSLIVFNDYECPFSGKMYDSLKTIRDEFSEEELKIVYRDLPLSFHANANSAALAVNAAGEQGKFLEMAELIFSDQENLSEEKYLEFAKELGLDIDQFQADMAAEEAQPEIDNDLAQAESYGATGTPSVYLNGVLVGGYMEADKLAEKIRDQL